MSSTSGTSSTIIFDESDNKIIDSAVNGRKNIFLHAPGGTGKSTLLKEIVKRMKVKNINVAMTATTGAAAVNVNGTTLHRFAGIRLGIEEKFILLKKVMSKRKYVDRWRETDVLIIDEVSMLGGDLFDKIEYVGRNVRNSRSHLPFAGMQIILSGDVLQLPPIRDSWVFEAQCWKSLNLTTFNLSKAKRYDDSDYFSMLLRVREAVHTSNDIDLLRSRHEEYLRVQEDIPKWEIQPTVVYSYRIDVSKYNEDKLNELPSDVSIFKAEDNFVFKRNEWSQEQKEYYKNFLSETIPEVIALKPRAQVILKKNIDIEAGLINGSRGVVVSINTAAKIAIVKFCNGVLTPIGYTLWENDDDDAVISRSQIPLVLGWASSVHSTQGSTLDLAVCDLGSSIFCAGQAYVAISRVRHINGLYLSEFEPTCIKCDKTASDFTNAMKDEENANVNVDPSKIPTPIEFIG